MTKNNTNSVADTKNDTQYSIEIYDINDLIPYVNNPRKISRGAVDKVASSIREFGFLNPIIIDKDNIIVTGHTRLRACKKLGIKTVPVIKAENLTPAQIQAYRIADNRTGEESEWDKELLSVEIGELQTFGLTLNFDINSLGFDDKELETLNNLRIDSEFDNKNENGLCDEDANIPEVDKTKKAITKKGDIWQLGKHRLMCGDATNFGDVEKLMDKKLADMIFTDPPYNVKIKDVVGIGKTKHEEFAMASGEMSEEEFIKFLTDVFTNYIATSKNGSIHYVCMDWKHVYEIMRAGRKTYTKKGFKQLCVWNKDIGGMGAFYRSKHEFVFAFKNGKESNTNNFELGQYGRTRNNVWDYPSPSSFAGREALEDENGKKLPGTSKELSMHPTVKPIKLVMDAILDCSNKNEIIADFFLGSGTTLIASEKTNRICYGMEISPHYCDVIVKRWEEMSGGKGRLV